MVYFTSIRRERGGPFTTCAYQIPLPFRSFLPKIFEVSHLPSSPFPGPNVFRTVRFKIIADDGTVILIPCETALMGDETRTHAS